jgi:hypothetical protein
MLKKDVTKENLTILQEGFKQYLNKKYMHLSPATRSTICSDSLFIIREDIGMEPSDVFQLANGIEKCRLLLEECFVLRGRKNPRQDASSYCRSIQYLKEYVCEDGEDVTLSSVKTLIKDRVHRGKYREDIPRPCIDEIEYYLKRWDDLEDYRIQEEALDKLFLVTYTDNRDIHDVLIKVSALNAFYSTNIYAPYKVAKHIVDLDIDKRLVLGDESLVNDIAMVVMNSETTINFYSFATKYCSRHKPLEYPIYDSYVDQLLRYFRNTDGFTSFATIELKNYYSFKNILIKFKEFYGLHDYSLKQIDKYLWQLGKEKFPKKY